MAIDQDGTGDDLSMTTSLPLSAFPFTMHIWVNPDSAATNMGLMGQDDGTSTNDVSMDVTGAGLPRARINNGSGAQAATGAVAVTAAAWQPITGVQTSATSRDIFLNGANKASSAVSRTFPAGTTRLLVGASSGGSNLFTGLIAGAAIWTTNLSDADVASMHISAGVGLSPLFVNRTGLVRYWRLLTTSDLTDAIGGVTLTLNGNPNTTTHPTIYEPGTLVGGPLLGGKMASARIR